MNRHHHPASPTHHPARANRPHAIPMAAEEPPADSAGGFVAFLRTLPLTTALTTAIGLALLTAAAAVAVMTPDPTAVARPAAYVALSATSLLGGMIAGRRTPDHPVLGALGAGVVFSLLTLLLAIPVGHLIPAPESLSSLSDSVTRPTVGMAVSTAEAAIIRLGVAVLHPVAAYLTRRRTDDSDRRRASHHPARKHPSAHAASRR